MKIGIIADTHDNVKGIHDAFTRFKEEDVEAVLHLGDWVSPFTMRFIKDYDIKIYSIFGNNEGSRELFPKIAEKSNVNIEFFQDPMEQEFDSVRFVVTHGDNKVLLENLKTSGKYDVVCFAHNHKPEIKEESDVLLINPGSILGAWDGKFDLDKNIVIYDTKTKEAKFIKI